MICKGIDQDQGREPVQQERTHTTRWGTCTQKKPASKSARQIRERAKETRDASMYHCLVSSQAPEQAQDKPRSQQKSDYSERVWMRRRGCCARG
jgi:hypothetical protein